MSAGATPQGGLLRRLGAALPGLLPGALVRRSLGDALSRYFGGSGDFSRSVHHKRLTHPYSQLAPVFACVRVKADALGSLPLMVSTLDDRVVESGPLAELAECPNPGMTGRAFFAATSAWLDLFGRVHWILDLDPAGRPLAVTPVAAPQMRPIYDHQSGGVLAWDFVPMGPHRVGGVERIEADRVHTIIDPDFERLGDPLAGLSPRRAVTNAISQFWAAELANEASLENGVEPGGVFKTDKNLTEEQLKQLERALRARQGSAMRRLAMVLEGGLEWQQTAATFTDMEFTELQKMTRTHICAAFRVPPPVVGFFEESNFAHADAAHEAFWVNTILPLGIRIAQEWSLAVLSRFDQDRSLGVTAPRMSPASAIERAGLGYGTSRRAARRGGRRFFAWFDASGQPHVQRHKLAQVEQAQKWFQMGVPLNAILQALDAPFAEVPWGDAGYKPIGLEPYPLDPFNPPDPFPGEPDGATPEPALLPDPPEAPEAPEADTDPQDAPGPPESADRSADPSDVRGPGEATRAKLWALWRKSWEGLERSAQDRVKRHFFELRAATLARLEQAAPQLAPPEAPEAPEPREAPALGVKPDTRRDVIGEVLFDIEEANGRLIGRVGPLLREAQRLGGEQVMREAADAAGKAEADPFNLADPNVVDRLRARQVRLADVNQSLRRRLARRLAEAVEQGLPFDEIAEGLKGEFNFARSRAQTIARTEIGAAVEEARAEGRRQAGVPLKSWLHSRKETGRPTHRATEDETTARPIPADDDFTIAGTAVRAPHPRATGDPAHDINCGCTTLSRFPGEDARAMAERYLRRGFLTYEQLNPPSREAPSDA